MNRAFVELDVVTDSAKRVNFKIYWQEKGMLGFDEQHIKKIRFNSSKSQHQFYFTDIGKIQLLRIDPSDTIGTVYLKKLVFKQPGFEPLKFETSKEFARLKVVQDIKTPIYEKDKGLKLNSTSIDGQLSFVPQLKYQIFAWVYFIHFGLLIAVVFLIARWLPAVSQKTQFVPYALVFVIGLVAVMAVITDKLHPDEYVHLSAVQYYSEYVLPPAIDDPSLANTYSVWGYSRVNNFEIYYNLAGRFLHLLRPLMISDLIATRLFSILLLFGLFWYALKIQDFRYFVLPLLMSAQTWYMFSYANSEAFALVLAIILAYQAACKHSILNLVLQEERPSRCNLKLLILGVLFGTILLTKVNFYLFLFFLVMYLLWRIAIGDFPHQARLWRRIAAICLVGVFLYGARFGWDVSQNGFGGRSAKLIEQSKHYSIPQFHPDTPLAEKNKVLELKERGVPFKKMFTSTKWPGKVFYSSFGSYGYTQYYGSEFYFTLVKYLCLALLGLILYGVLKRGPPSVYGLLSITAGSVLLLVGIAMWQSWAVVFQAQGRYLLPILPMIAVMYYEVRVYVNQTAVMLLCLALFLLASYSYIFIGLLQIEKLRYPILATF